MQRFYLLVCLMSPCKGVDEQAAIRKTQVDLPAIAQPFQARRNDPHHAGILPVRRLGFRVRIVGPALDGGGVVRDVAVNRSLTLIPFPMSVRPNKRSSRIWHCADGGSVLPGCRRYAKWSRPLRCRAPLQPARSCPRGRRPAAR